MENIVSSCFHGRLDRQVAEERLNDNGQVGSFLLRESERKSGSYVLSYLGKNGINHFRIAQSFGSYFIGGRQFESLLDLITHYSQTSNLYTDEKLVYPIAPPEPIPSRQRLLISILPYTKLAQSDELSFKKGDIFLLLDEVGDGWLWCRDVKTGSSGLVFSQLVEEIEDDIDPNEVFPWFHAKLSKADAVDKLAQAGPGSFLIRPSDNSPGNYTLFYHVGSTVQRFLIVKDAEHRYLMGGRLFDTLGQIVELYQAEPIMEGHILQLPVMTSMSRSDPLSRSSTSIRADLAVEKSQDVYNTVKMSREAVQLKQDHQLKGWLSLKKGDIQKKWKSYFFVLNSRDRHLYYYEKPQQTKPKGLIDLSYSFVYRTHESLFEWPQCFQLVEKCLPCFANFFHLKCDGSNIEFRTWLNAIGSITSLNQSTKKSVDVVSNARKDGTFDVSSRKDKNRASCEIIEEKKAIYLNLIEAQSLKMSMPCFLVAYNQDIKIAKTRPKTSPSTLFNEDGFFALENLTSDVKSVSILLVQNGKKTKPSIESPQFSIELNSLNPDGEQFDRWFKLNMGHSSDSQGCLRLRVQFCNDIVMGLPEYAALEDLICDPNMEILKIFEQFCHRDHLALARHLKSIFSHRKICARILTYLIERETSSQEQDPNMLFKVSSLTSALLETYLRSMSRVPITTCLRGVVMKLLDDKICCELNTAKLESHNVSQKACENFEALLDLLDELVSKIYDSISLFPLQARFIFAYLQNLVKLKWPNETLIRTHIVSSFLLHRLICPTVLNPKQFNLISETPSENAIRNLTLVAKCLQNLGNFVDNSQTNSSLAQTTLTTLDDYAIYPPNQLRPNEQDEYDTGTSSIVTFILSPQIDSLMDVVNPFILKNKIGMVKFVDELCNIDVSDPKLVDKLPTSGLDDNNNGDNVQTTSLNQFENPASDLASIHSICEKYRGELEHQSTTSSSAKKLVTVMNVLSKHKQYYSNLRRCSQTISTKAHI